MNDIFADALERAPEERERFVHQACAGDDELRREVVSLLGRHNQAAGFLEPDARVPEVVNTPDYQPGQRLGPYVIVRELGRGGMGIVYLAEDTRLGRQVALKALSAGSTPDTVRRERLKREAQAAAALGHAGIATVYALEEIDGQLLISSEYVAGRTLREEIDGGPLSTDATAQIALDVARALSAAHARGVVHRDLKPENIIRSEEGITKILDFGLALMQPRVGGDGSPARLTLSGMLLGTPAYMAPEQLQGRNVDFRADLFSFGIVVYEMATGAHPFGWAGRRSSREHGTGGEPAVTAEARPLPPALEGIVRRCLQTDPAQRYGDTRELVSDLERLRAGGTGSSQALSEPEPPSHPAIRLTARGWWQLHQVTIALLYGAMVYPAWLVLRAAGGPFALLLFLSTVVAAALAIVLPAPLGVSVAVSPGLAPGAAFQARPAAAMARRRHNGALGRRRGAGLGNSAELAGERDHRDFGPRQRRSLPGCRAGNDG